MDYTSQPLKTLLQRTSANYSPKLFIGGLEPSTQRQALIDYFGQFGEIVDCVVKPDRSTRGARSFGFVTFKEPHTAHFVSTLVHVIDGKKIDVKKAQRKSTPVDSMVRDPSFKTSKIFVGGLPKELTLPELNEYFSQFGQIIDSCIIPDKQTMESRCFGFVQFLTCQAVDRVIENYYKIKINGKWIECKKALPKEACQELQKNEHEYLQLMNEKPKMKRITPKEEYYDKENDYNYQLESFNQQEHSVHQESKLSKRFPPQKIEEYGPEVEEQIPRSFLTMPKIEDLDLSSFPSSEEKPRYTNDAYGYQMLRGFVKEEARPEPLMPINENGLKGLLNMDRRSLLREYQVKREYNPF